VVDRRRFLGFFGCLVLVVSFGANLRNLVEMR
jgi:hypothetical protein